MKEMIEKGKRYICRVWPASELENRRIIEDKRYPCTDVDFSTRIVCEVDRKPKEKVTTTLKRFMESSDVDPDAGYVIVTVETGVARLEIEHIDKFD